MGTGGLGTGDREEDKQSLLGFRPRPFPSTACDVSSPRSVSLNTPCEAITVKSSFSTSSSVRRQAARWASASSASSSVVSLIINGEMASSRNT